MGLVSFVTAVWRVGRLERCEVAATRLELALEPLHVLLVRVRLGYPGRLLEPLHTQCTPEKNAQPEGTMECNRLYYAARACESRRAYSARCVRLDSAPHAALCDSLKLDTSRYLTHYSSSITQHSSAHRPA